MKKIKINFPFKIYYFLYKLVISMAFIILLLINSCSKESHPVESFQDTAHTNLHDNFAIYFLKDTTIKIFQIINKNINDLEIDTIAWLTNDDMECFDYSSHCIYLKKNNSYFFPDYKLFYQFPKSWIDRPFVVVANMKKCYIGYMGSIFSSYNYPAPFIQDFDVYFYPTDIIHIDWIYSFGHDNRYNDDVRIGLIKTNLLHEGISITIDSLWINNSSDTSTVGFIISIANNDTDNLYVLDPDKTGVALLNYYTQGPVLYDYNNQIYYDPIYREIKKPEPYNSFNKNWFTKIEHGKTINREIIIKGYVFIPKGNYLVSYLYNNPVQIDKSSRQLSDGRYWIGPTSSKLIEISGK